jgi:two-component system sensor histidine kinase KdpD
VASFAERNPMADQSSPSQEYAVRGRLKVFLGYASGVGKSFRMLDEGRRRRERGQDVVVAAVQPNLSDEVVRVIVALEIIPFKYVNGRPGIDVEAILQRSPKVCLVDGLAYNNPPGSRHERRWEDVLELLEAGISVITSINLQRIEEKREAVEAITGKHVNETVPLGFLHTADEIVIVDAPPSVSTGVSAEDNASAPQRLSQLQLSELREIALLLAAEIVDKQLERYLARHGIEQLWGTQERILVWLSPKGDAARMIESGVRNRDRFHGELIATYVNRPDWSPEQRKKINAALKLAREKGAEVVELDGEDPVEIVLRYARQRGITQIFAGHRERERWWERLFGSNLDRLIRQAEGIDVRVFPHT